MRKPLSRPVKRALSFASAATAVLGVGFALAAVAAPGLLQTFYELAGPGTVTDVGPAARLGAGIYGGLMAGWGTMLFLVAREVPMNRAAGVGLLTWFVVDSAASVATGYPLNVASNAAFLALFAPVYFAGRGRSAEAPAT